MSRSYHVHINVKGILQMNLKEFHQKYHGVFSSSDGIILSDEQARTALLIELEKGHRVIPCGPCDNFDYEKGCQGHDHPDEEAEK